MWLALLKSPTAWLVLGVLLLGGANWIQRQALHAARTDRDAATLRADGLEAQLTNAKRANAAQAKVIAAQGAELDAQAIAAAKRLAEAQAAEQRATARATAAEQRARTAATRAAARAQQPECVALRAIDTSKVCAK